jgi:hypothetical protein
VCDQVVARGATYSKLFSLLASHCSGGEKYPSRAGARSREISFLDSSPLTPQESGRGRGGPSPCRGARIGLEPDLRRRARALPGMRTRLGGARMDVEGVKGGGAARHAPARGHGPLEALEGPHAPMPAPARPPASQGTAQAASVLPPCCRSRQAQATPRPGARRRAERLAALWARRAVLGGAGWKEYNSYFLPTPHLSSPRPRNASAEANELEGARSDLPAADLTGRTEGGGWMAGNRVVNFHPRAQRGGRLAVLGEARARRLEGRRAHFRKPCGFAARSPRGLYPPPTASPVRPAGARRSRRAVPPSRTLLGHPARVDRALSLGFDRPGCRETAHHCKVARFSRFLQ